MELHALDRPRAVAQRHEFTGGGVGARCELGGERLAHDQRVVATGREGRRQSGEQAAAVVVHRVCMAVDRSVRAPDRAAASECDELVPEAHTERRHVRTETQEERVCRGARLWTAGARAEHEALERRQRVRQLVRSQHVDRVAQLGEQSHHVPRERVLVVDEQDTHHADIRPRRAAR
jgi:hypothetical protein